MHKDVLVEGGFSEKEASVYDALLTLGESPAQAIVKETKLKRGIVYKILKDFESKDLVRTFTKHKKTYFKLEHPYTLTTHAEEELKKAQHAYTALQTNIANIVSSFNAAENRPGVKVFEGTEGIKELYADTLREGKEILAVLQTSDVDPEMYIWLTKHYAPKRAEAGIWAKVMVSEGEDTQKYINRDEKELRETKVIAKKKFPVAIEMNIYGDKVAFFNFKKGSPIIGILINNPFIAETMRALFYIAWDQTS